jgi:hypothetical protein
LFQGATPLLELRTDEPVLEYVHPEPRRRCATSDALGMSQVNNDGWWALKMP